MLGLVESFRDVSGEHGVHGAHDDQRDRVAERNHVRGVDERRADQYVCVPARIVVDGPRRAYQHPHAVDEHLRFNQSINRKQPSIPNSRHKIKPRFAQNLKKNGCTFAMSRERSFARFAVGHFFRQASVVVVKTYRLISESNDDDDD